MSNAAGKEGPSTTAKATSKAKKAKAKAKTKASKKAADGTGGGSGSESSSGDDEGSSSSSVSAGTLLGDTVNSVLKVHVCSMEADYDSPWQLSKQESCTGSGVAIDVDGEVMVLTAAHVVADQTFVQIQKTTDPEKVVATLAAVCHECDLALLRVDPESVAFLSDVPAAELGGSDFLPDLRDKVSVVGFPVGGDEVSITDGVVSRVEMQSYSHSARTLLAITVDAAVNSGNSGGPVFSDDVILGIAVQVLNDAQNIGEIVPCPVIQHFLECYRRNVPQKFPTIGIKYVNMENPYMRRRFGMNEDETGVMVASIIHKSSADGVLQPKDIILEVDGVKIANNATIRFMGKFRMVFVVLYQSRYVGDPLDMRILRAGERMDVTVHLQPVRRLVKRHEYDVRPSYFVYAGCVFMVLSRDYIATWKDYDDAPVDLLHAYENGKLTAGRSERIILTHVLGNRLSVGYDDFEDSLIDKVNGVSVVDMRHFVALVTGATDHVDLETDGGGFMTFDPAAVADHTPEILSRYNLPNDRSADLADVEPVSTSTTSDEPDAIATTG